MRTFIDREEAGRLLAEVLAGRFDRFDVVCFIPRGGVSVAAPVAQRFSCPLFPVLVAKLGHPSQPEFAIGAMDPDGRTDFSEEYSRRFSDLELLPVLARARAKLEEGKRRYARLGLSQSLRGKQLVLVDDGLATGESCVSALKFLRRQEPKRLVLAVPCASVSGSEHVRPFCDEVLTFNVPDPSFMAVGDYYRDFHQVEHEEVARVLADFQERFATRAA